MGATKPKRRGLYRIGTQPAQLEKITLKVEGMTCGGCAIGVKKTLEKQKGVRKADVSFEKGQAIAEVEKGKVKPEELAAKHEGTD
ncbi:MAG TPA: cation transporter [Acidobacteriota bacterium]|jgi:copper chaperone